MVDKVYNRGIFIPHLETACHRNSWVDTTLWFRGRLNRLLIYCRRCCVRVWRQRVRVSSIPWWWPRQRRSYQVHVRRQGDEKHGPRQVGLRTSNYAANGRLGPRRRRRLIGGLHPSWSGPRSASFVTFDLLEACFHIFYLHLMHILTKMYSCIQYIDFIKFNTFTIYRHSVSGLPCQLGYKLLSYQAPAC